MSRKWLKYLKEVSVLYDFCLENGTIPITVFGINEDGFRTGFGVGTGYGDGHTDGDGYGNGSGNRNGSGFGNGNPYGFGNGDGNGYGTDYVWTTITTINVGNKRW